MDTTKKPDDKKIAIGKDGKKSQIIINPPEVQNPVPYKENFLQAIRKHRVSIDEKTKIVLNAKATQYDISASVLEQVYARGIKSLPLNSNLTREQHAMNRVNSFLSGGAAMKEDMDLIPIIERIVTKQLKGTGGGARPHIKREKSPYNNKILYHVVDAKGQIKHTTSDETAARRHLIQKYQAYLEGVENPMKRFEGTKSLVKTYKDDTPGEKDIKEEGKGLWANIHAKRERIKRGSGERMRKPGSEGAPTAADLKRSAVKEEVVTEVNKHSMLGKIQRGHELKKKVDSTWKDIGDAQKAGDKAAGSRAFRKHERYANLERPGTWTKVKEEVVTEISQKMKARYVTRASDDFGHQNMGRRNTTGDQQKEFARKEKNRQQGIARALRKEETKGVAEAAMSHQATTTMKHITNPTEGEKKAAKDIKPGIKGYRDRIAMLHSADARGDLKKEAYYRTNPYGYSRASGAASFRRSNPDEPDGPSYSTKRSSSYRAPAAKEEPHDVHINGKKWKTFGSQRHAQNVANKIKGATVHKSPQSQQEARKFGYDAINASFKKRTGQSLEDRAKHYAATSERLKKMQADYEAQGIIKKKDEGQGK